MYLCFITSCVTNSSEGMEDGSERKANTTEPLSIAAIHQKLYIHNKFEGSESIDLEKSNPLKTVGIVKAFRYNYLAEEGIDASMNASFYLAIFQYQDSDIAVAAIRDFMKNATTSNGSWRFNDFLIPIGENVIWLHADCTLPDQNWQDLTEVITGSLSEVPKSINCECGEDCVYD
ncbi:MAG: hypothetical protein R3E32_27765 [Chitinophagales bacterium]